MVERSQAQLIVSFDNLSNVNDAGLARDSWGYDFFRDEGWSHLGVLNFKANWYRDDGCSIIFKSWKKKVFFPVLIMLP